MSAKPKWFIDAEGNRILAEDDRRTIICHLSASIKNPEVESDARLIAAAPELLAALQNLLTWKNGNENVPPGHNGNEPWNWAVQAIAKATGESP